MSNIDDTYVQENMNNNHDLSDSEDKNPVCVPTTITARPVNSQMSHQVAEFFQQNVREPKNNMTTLQVRHTIRDTIFPIVIPKKVVNGYKHTYAQFFFHFRKFHYFIVIPPSSSIAAPSTFLISSPFLHHFH